MRLVELWSREGDDAFALDFHPHLTVVRGLDPARRRQLLHAVESLVNGRSSGLDGVVEAHGVLLDIGDELVSVLGLGGETIDPVVRRGDLPGPGHDETLAASRRRHAERTLDELRERLDGSEAAVADARRRCDVAERRLATDGSGRASGTDATDGAGREPGPVSGADAMDGPGRSATEIATRQEAVRAAKVAAAEARRRLEVLVVDPTVGTRLSAGRTRRAAATKGLAAAMAELDSVSQDLDGNAERALEEAHASVVELEAGRDPDIGGSGSERLSQVREALPALALRLVRHRNAVGRIAQLEASVAGLQSEEQAAMEQITRTRTAHTCAQAELRGRLRAANAELAAANEALLDVTAGDGGAASPATGATVEPPNARSTDAAAPDVVSPDAQSTEARSPGARSTDAVSPAAVAPDAGRVQMERRLLVARIDLGGAQAASELLRAECDAHGRRIGGEEEPAGTARSRRSQAVAQEEALYKELEWYLLSRLVHQRSIGVAGSAPLLLDDAFARLPEGTGPHLLEWLERLAPAVQVIVLSDDPQLAAWLERLPAAKAASVDGA